MAPLGRPPVMLDVVEEHFEELDFLWELREGVIFAPDWNLDDLAELEERAEAHLDGLRLAELHAVDVARPHLMGEHKFGATAATFVFMETGEEEFFAEVLKAFVEAPPDARDGIRIGLRHSKIETVEKRLFELAREGEPGLRAAAADVLAFNRRALPEVRDLVEVEDDAVRVLIYGALGRGKTPLETALVQEGLRAKSPEVRRATLEAAARSGMEGVGEISLQAATRSVDPVPEAMVFLGVLGNPQSFSVLSESLQRPELASAALRGLGALGRLDAISLLIAAMDIPEHARTAAAAFHRITGAADLESDPPSSRPGDPNPQAEFADERGAPSAAKARTWWEHRKDGFNQSLRWQYGRAIVFAKHGQDLRPFMLSVLRDAHLAARAARRDDPPDHELLRRLGRRLNDDPNR